MKIRNNMTDNRFGWVVFCFLFVGSLSGCTAAGSDCREDSDCLVNQQCSSGGGVFFGGGICLAGMSANQRDVGADPAESGGDAGDKQDADVGDGDVSVADASERDGAVDDDTSDGGDAGDVTPDYRLSVRFTTHPAEHTQSRRAQFEYLCEDDSGGVQACTYECFVDAEFVESEEAVAVDGQGQWVDCDNTRTVETAWAGKYTLSVRARDENGQTAEVTFRWQNSYVEWLSVSAGARQTCAIDTSHQLWCWGVSEYGALAQKDVTKVDVPTRVASDEHWLSVSVGQDHACGINDKSSLYCWGSNTASQVGAGDKSRYEIPVPLELFEGGWKSVSAGATHTCAIYKEQLYCWGWGVNGQLGLRTQTRAEKPQQVMPEEERQWLSVSVAAEYSCAVEGKYGLHCWGLNTYGLLGIGDRPEYRIPTQVQSGVVRDFGSVSAGQSHTCGVLRDGNLLCWGRGKSGQLGLGQLGDRKFPEYVEGKGYRQVSAGVKHTCAVNDEKQLFCWGDGKGGLLGFEENDLLKSANPRLVDEKGEQDWLEVSAGDMHSCGIRGQGELWCWGGNRDNQLGLPEVTDSIYEPRKLRVYLD